tara:strand:+ start:15976 stop:16413 length:438 start_codon:yes stop_codon:yes gene_type:complete
MENIKERIKKRALIIDKLTEKQNKDVNLLLSNGGKMNDKIITKEKILSVVMKINNVDPNKTFSLKGGKVNRLRANVEVRHMYFYLCKKLTGETLKDLGHIYYHNCINHVFDHSTVIHGIKSWNDLMFQMPIKRKLTDKAIKILTV